MPEMSMTPFGILTTHLSPPAAEASFKSTITAEEKTSVLSSGILWGAAVFRSAVKTEHKDKPFSAIHHRPAAVRLIQTPQGKHTSLKWSITPCLTLILDNSTPQDLRPGPVWSVMCLLWSEEERGGPGSQWDTSVLQQWFRRLEQRLRAAKSLQLFIRHSSVTVLFEIVTKSCLTSSF